MTLSISKRAIAMIVDFEVSDPVTYAASGARPSWPGGASGVTIGIGYDLGYTSKDQIAADWAGILPAATVTRLCGVAGIYGADAEARVHQLADVVVPWVAAQLVFTHGDIPRYVTMTTRAFDNCDSLSPDSLGALVSLVFNRGTSTAQGTPDRRLEMRQIGAAMTRSRFSLVPGYMRAMKRLWEGEHGMPGLVNRREREAALFEAGLARPASAPLDAPTTAPERPVAPLPAAPLTDLSALTADELDDIYNGKGT